MSDVKSLPTTPDPPAFGCVVYLRQDGESVAARVANLDGLAVSCESEAAALKKIVPMFRQRITEAQERGEDVPWVDPPHPKAEDEVKRFLPIHL